MKFYAKSANKIHCNCNYSIAKVFLISFIAIIHKIQMTNTHYCGGNNPFNHNIEIFKSKENSRFLKSNQKYESLRIHLDYAAIENDNKYKEDYLFLKQAVMPQVEEVYERILSVKRLTSNLVFDTNHCAGVEIPEKYLIGSSHNGIEADLIIFVKIDNSGFFESNNIEAAASHCIIHGENFRPLAGIIIFKPNLIRDLGKDKNDSGNNRKTDKYSKTDIDYISWLAVHELSHVLAFNSKLYEYFIDSEGNRLGENKVLGKFKYKNKDITYIKSPILLEKARKHFNCKTLLGVPLEYHGGEGTAGAHWSKRFMNTDYMIGDSYGENLISEITLAIFEDSGWYKVDYNKANLFLWGKDKGCEFFDESFPCIESMENGDNKENNNSKNSSNQNNKTYTESCTNKTKTNNKLKSQITQQKKSDIQSKSSSPVKKLSIANKNKENNFSYKTNKLYEKKSNNSKNVNNEVIKEELDVIYKSNFKEFCEGFNMPSCSINRHFKGICKGVITKSPLPENERYFANNRIGGAEILTDRCPIALEEKIPNRYYNNNCRYKNIDDKVLRKDNELDNKNIQKPKEKVCDNCVCIMSSLSKDEIKNAQKIKEVEIKISSNDNNKQVDTTINSNKQGNLQNDSTLSDNIDNSTQDPSKNNEYNGINNDISNFNNNLDNSTPEQNNILSYEEKPESSNKDIFAEKNKNKETTVVKDSSVKELTTLEEVETIGNQLITANCFETECEDKKLFIIFEVNDKTLKVHCKTEGYYSVPNFEGVIECPDPDIICNHKYRCTFGCE